MTATYFTGEQGYNEIFSHSGIEEILEGLRDELSNISAETLNLIRQSILENQSSIEGIGQALGELATALGESDSPKAHAYGEILGRFGQALQYGTQLYAEGVTAETIGKIITDYAVGTVATDVALLTAGFIAVNAVQLIGGELAISTLIYGGLFFASPVGQLVLIGLVFGTLYAFDDYLTEPLVDLIYDHFTSPLINLFRDPLVLDLDQDGVELTALVGSTVRFDFDGDGLAERTGWVGPDDGILVRDANGNGLVDGALELFGSPTQDGFAVLERLDSNGDGKIDADDAKFTELRVWRDLNQNGSAELGEMLTLVEAGVQSISISTQDVNGTNQGHTVGNSATFTRADGTTGTAQTIYFETDRQDTVSDNTPNFEIADGVLLLPQLPGSGQINSIAWKASADSDFRAAWAALTENAADLPFDQLRAQFEDLLLEWAGADEVLEFSRGEFVNAQHLAFVEKFFGSEYSETYMDQSIASSPTTEAFGANIEITFHQIASVMLTAFLAQSSTSNVLRGGDLTAILSGPYFAYSLLNFGSNDSDASQVAATVETIIAMTPEQVGDAAVFLGVGASINYRRDCRL